MKYDYCLYARKSTENDEKQALKNVNIRSQMKYIVEKGSTEEKKRLLKNLGTKIYLKDKAIYLNQAQKTEVC